MDVGIQTVVCLLNVGEPGPAPAPELCTAPACTQVQSLRMAAEQLNRLLEEENKQLSALLFQEQMAKMDLENRIMESSVSSDNL
jgi:hypothetical protein